MDITQTKKDLFFDETIVNKYFLFEDRKDLYLTKKQAECSAYMVFGATAKECAKELNLSHRTVEEHIQEVKSKIFSSTKKNLSHKQVINFLKDKGIGHVVFSKKIKN